MREFALEAEVTGVTLDELLPIETRAQLRLIKMDIEGVEVLALRGMERFLREVRPCLVVEAYDERLKLFGTTLAEMRAFIEGLGYRESRPWDGNVYYDPAR